MAVIMHFSTLLALGANYVKNVKVRQILYATKMKFLKIEFFGGGNGAISDL